MDILAFSDQLSTRMNADISSSKDDVVAIGQSLAKITIALDELRTFVGAYEFNTQAEEIKFFKEVKPTFLSQYYYHKHLLEIHAFDFHRGFRRRLKYYHRYLKKIEKSAKKDKEFYCYCLTNQVHSDHLYFIRSQHLSVSVHADVRFSTTYDVKLGKILANQMIRQRIIELLNEQQGSNPSATGGQLNWTASKTDLTELIYALEASRVVNNGNADIKRIASAFERVFSVQLGDYYRTFQSIRNRKNSQTTFLDRLMAQLQRKIDEEF